MTSFGKTGNFPQGKIHESDEGELEFGISYLPEYNQVMIMFNTPVAWMCLSPDATIAMAHTLIKHATEGLAAQKEGNKR